VTATLEIKPGKGLSNLLFGATMKEAQKLFGKPDDTELLDEIEHCCAVVWHYWEDGIALFFDENDQQRFNSVEIDNKETILWGHPIFTYTEKKIIEVFKCNGILLYETELQEWGEKRLSFDNENIDFYFEKNKLTSVNYGKIMPDSSILILSN
jgi:hypothetical protein